MAITTRKPSDILEEALELVKPRERWCQGTLARTKDGRVVTVSSADAYKFCAQGAVRKVAGHIGEVGSRALDYLDYGVGDSYSGSAFKLDAAEVNDNDDPGRAHANVIRRFRAAIKRAKAAGE